MAEIVRCRRLPVPSVSSREIFGSRRAVVTSSGRRSAGQSLSSAVRTCIGCRARDDRSAMLRVVAVTREGAQSDPVFVCPDPRGRLGGRGAWLHPAAGCVEQAERRRAFARALRLRRGVDITAVREFVVVADASEPDPNGSAGNES